MNSTLWSLIATFGVAICSGISYLAYRHPKAYEKHIFKPLSFIIGFIALNIFIGKSTTIVCIIKNKSMESYWTKERLLADFQQSSKLVDSIFFWTILWGALLAFLFILKMLPDILEFGKETLPKSGKDL